jgi:mono/diheme cytochrome c family protein/uncharacterized membrane protein
MQHLLGPFHPVLVHLPIGILLLACLFQWLVLRDAYKKLEPAIGIALFWGMVFAILSCITGFMLSRTGDYEGDLVSNHQWAGIWVAIVSIVQYYLYKRSVNAGFARWLALILFILIIITGHLGGSLTHGSDYLSKVFSSDSDVTKSIRKPIPDIQAAKVYADVVRPLFQEKCYGCHGPNKQKGKFRLDQPDFIMKGGKEGNDVLPGNPTESELIKRILLERNEEHHMPPKEKPQLTENERALLHWWVETGASFDKQVKDLPQQEKIKPILISMQGVGIEKKPIADIPEKETGKASESAINKLKERGAMVLPVAQNSNYLMVNFVTTDSLKDKDLELLMPIREQLIWLKLSDQPVGDEAMKTIGKLNNLTRIQLDHTAITDKGLVPLQQLSNLVYLNLVATKITSTGLSQLKSLSKLQSIYLYQTAIGKSEWENLKKIFPKAVLDSGGYIVPTLESDTTVMKEKKKEK